MPMSFVSKMYTLCNSPAALKLFLNDPSSTGSWASVKFLMSYMNFVPALEPEKFDVCPILLTQPAEDLWSPLELSALVLSRVKKAKITKVMLENAGQYPLEDPVLEQMVEAIVGFWRELSPK